MAYIESQGITIHYAPAGASDEAWKSGWCDVGYKTVSIWPTAFELFGWDRVTSVLIHEFGHCKLYEAEGLWLGSVEVEQKANEYGFQLMPPEMIPESYHADRSFSLQTYRDVAAFATGEQVLKAFEEWDGKPFPDYGQAQRASTASF